MIQGCSLKTGKGRWILTATLLASGANFMLSGAVVVALPAIQAYFRADISGIQWVLNSQLLALSALLLVGGCLGDIYGRKRVFVAGIIIYTLGLVLSGTAERIGLLIAYQAIGGLGSALMVPQSLAMINSCFVEQERGQAIGLWAGLSGGVAAAGPWLGGWLTGSFGWQSIFFVTVPVTAAAAVIAVLSVPENKDPEPRALDWQGSVFILLGLLGLAYGLISGPVSGWGSPAVITALVAGPAAITVFILIERRQRDPLVPPGMLRNRLVAGANTVTLLLYFALNGLLIFVSLNLQQVRGYSPVLAGLALLPPVAIITFLAGPLGALADKIGSRPQMIAGPLLVAAGSALLLTGGIDASYLRDFLPGLALFGLGMALVIPPLTKAALAVEPVYSGAASGVNNAVARAAALLAVAVLGAVAVTVFTGGLNESISSLDLPPAEQQQIIEQAKRLGDIDVPQSLGAIEYAAAETAVKAAFISGFRWITGICAGLALLAGLVSLATIKSPPGPIIPENSG